MERRLAPIFASLLLMSAGFPAEAHTGAGAAHGYSNGLLHPLTGVDHVLVMLGVGLWGGALGGRSRWLLPFIFLTMMAAGAGLDFSGMSLRTPEAWIAVSVLALGLILCCGRQAQAGWAACLAAVFALGHGYVHAGEISAGVDVFPYVAGFLSSTALLLGLGMSFSQMPSARFKIVKTTWGLVSAVVGAALLIGA